MSKYKTISVSEETFKEFERMAQSYGLTNKGLIETMLQFFKASKADPREPQADNPTDAIKALTRALKEESNRVISFIKQQEKVTLTPMKEMITDISSSEGVTRKHELRIVNNNIKKVITHLQIDS